MPSETSRKILLAVSGVSPQIVTETLYALVTNPDNPWIPDEIHLLSTSEGCKLAWEKLQGEGGPLARLCADYLPQGKTIRFDENCLHVFTRDAEPLADIRDLEDSASVADAIAGKVWELTRDENTEIHASIAGGRKSMGFLLGYAMSLYGRQQDRLSHVLVNEGFESSAEFFFPPRTPITIHDRNGQPHNTADARISLAEIPIFHLRDRLPKVMLKKPASFSQLVEVMRNMMAEPSVVFDVAARKLWCQGVEVELSKVNYSFYLYAAKKSLNEAFFDINEISLDDYISIKESEITQDNTKENGSSQKHRSGIEKYISQHKAGLDEFVRDRLNEIKTSLKEKLGILGQTYMIKKRGSHSFIEIENIEIIETPNR